MTQRPNPIGSGKTLTDTERLDRLSRTGGFVTGQADGKPAVRLFGSDDWHPDLRAAIDAQTATGGRTTSIEE